jgi:hypothetical protein
MTKAKHKANAVNKKGKKASTRPSIHAYDAGVAEFRFLRTEMEWLINNGMRYQQFAIVLTAAGLSASALTITQYSAFYPGLAAALSAVFAYLGILYYWVHVEIHVVAGYLQKQVRQRVRDASGVDDWWNWEEYKDKQWKNIFKSPNLFRARLLAFLVISFLFFGTSIWAAAIGLEGMMPDLLLGAANGVLCLGALSLLGRLAYLLAFRSRLSELLLNVDPIILTGSRSARML